MQTKYEVGIHEANTNRAPKAKMWSKQTFLRPQDQDLAQPTPLHDYAKNAVAIEGRISTKRLVQPVVTLSCSLSKYA